jgi:hypothetical protein
LLDISKLEAVVMEVVTEVQGRMVKKFIEVPLGTVVRDKTGEVLFEIPKMEKTSSV